MVFLSKYDSVLCSKPALFLQTFSTIKITPPEPQCPSLWKMIKICAFSSINY